MIITAKGDYPSFSQLRHAYIRAYDEHPPVEKYLRVGAWRDDLLHVSDLGSCLRKQMLRLQGAPKKRRSAETVANEQLMFWQGNMIHALTAGALDWAGILVGYEEELPGLPPGWTGHYDCIYQRLEDDEYVCWDGKSVRQNAFDYAFDWPKTKDCMQMGGYLGHLSVARGEIEYIDRGGSNRPVLCFVPWEFVERATKAMLITMGWVETGKLPEVLPKVYTASYYKVRGADVYRLTGVKYGTSWECGWCDYLHGFQDRKTKLWTIDPGSPCKPEMVAPDFVAKNKDGRWQIDDGHQEGVEGFLAEQVAEWSPDEDVETSI